MSGILTKLEARFGRNRVVDVFANTGMALKAQELNIGCYVVRGVLSPEQLEGWHQQLEDSLTDIGLQFGTRAVDLKGRSGPAAYRTIQCTSGKCTCKYDYAATARHTLWKTKDVKPFSAVSDWLHDEIKVERWLHFDEIVANIYDRGLNQCAGFHTDQNPLLGETSNILSVSMGAPGVFYWRPNPDGKLRGAGEGWKKEQRRHEAEQTAGLWGCTPLLPGDILLCRGTFQHHLVHGSLDYREAANVEEVVSQYQVCPEALQVLQSEAYRRYFVDSSLPQPDRSVITFRKIQNHDERCPEIVSGNSGARLREAGRAAWPVGTVIASYEALSRKPRRARPVQEPPESQGDHGVWARPEGQTREERATRGDRQHDVIPPWRASTGEERARAPVFGEGLGEVPNSEDSSTSSEDTPPQLEGPQPPAHPPPAEMLPGDPDAFRRAPPQPQQDDAVSPSEVRHRVFEDQVKETAIFMRSCCEMFDKLEDRIIEVSQPDTRARIQETLAELAAKIKEGARVQNIAECRLEVAASLYLIF